MADFEGKIALVTGASRGIGYHAAKTLAQNGAHVIALARTVGGLEELDDEVRSVGGSATLVPLDLMEHDAIDRLGDSIFERWQRLDIFVANAGMLGGLSPIEHFEPNTFEKVLALNVTSNWRMMRSMSPLLRESESGRVIALTSSNTAETARSFWGAYAASQAALITLLKTWSHETEKSAIRINMLDPGPTRTALRAQAMPGEDLQKISHPASIGKSILHLASSNLEATGKIYSHIDQRFL